ncbi:hypothetical protein PUN71_022855, partial [Arthrobacter sp. NQ7]|uniref:hypothetical protein n=1 Tax=Arthrobacter sp. NQ7 TaxID=3032303 RepID=UPI00240F3729
LGTLLSSQTTDTPGTTQTNVQDRSGATFQTYPIPHPEANPSSQDFHRTEDRPTPIPSTLKSNQNLALNWGFWPPGEQFFTVSPAATQKTIHAHPAHRKPGRK